MPNDRPTETGGPSLGDWSNAMLQGRQRVASAQAQPDQEQPDVEAEREFPMNAAAVALRAATPNLSDEAIRLIADYIRFVAEREEREGGA